MVRWCLLPIAVAGALLAAPACGVAAPTRILSAAEELSALHDAGFRVHHVRVGAVATAAAHLPFVDLLAVRFGTVSSASLTYRRGYSPKALAKQFHEARTNPLYKGVLAEHFADSMVTTMLVCNVILVSYSPKPDPSLRHKFDRALNLLTKAC
jgi:hypothetical protein